MIKIDDEIKDFIKQNKDILTPVAIFNLCQKEIFSLLDYGLKVSTIKKILEKELEININVKTLHSYLYRNKKRGIRGKKERIEKKENNNKQNKDTLGINFLGTI